MIKVKNNRQNPGAMFHYAHFICDCLFPEIINEIYKYDEVIREKTLEQTIGNFNKIYSEVMQNKNTELLPNDFKKLDIDVIIYKKKEYYCDKDNFTKFRDYIFLRYNIDSLVYNNNYPEVILIRRGERVNLIDDHILFEQNDNILTGKERREIKNIDAVEDYLKNKYPYRFKSLYFENMPFVEQIKYFNNAKLIICAHGAVMSNMFFCKNGTRIIEVTCGKNFVFFNTMVNILNIKLSRCLKNEYNNIIRHININTI
jgi:hypothetical protein